MADSLIANANGKYYENLFTLTGKPNQVKVIVEDEWDVSFWHDVLSTVASHKIFDVTPYQYSSLGYSDLAKGKLHILQLARNNQLSKNYWGCLDSDYDYLLSATSYNGQLMNENPYLLQTYAYSIENLFCCAETLEGVCFKANKANPQMDFIDLMRNISNILYPLLIWSLYLESKGIHKFSPAYWTNIFSCDKNILTHSMDDIIMSLKEKVYQSIVDIVCHHRKEIDEKRTFQENLLDNYGLDSNNCFLFVRGHDIHKYILNVFLKGIQTKSKKRYIAELKVSGASSEVINNNISHYRSTLMDIEDLFNMNYEYKNHCPYIYEKMKRDILRIA